MRLERDKRLERAEEIIGGEWREIEKKETTRLKEEEEQERLRIKAISKEKYG